MCMIGFSHNICRTAWGWGGRGLMRETPGLQRPLDMAVVLMSLASLKYASHLLRILRAAVRCATTGKMTLKEHAAAGIVTCLASTLQAFASADRNPVALSS